MSWLHRPLVDASVTLGIDYGTLAQVATILGSRAAVVLANEAARVGNLSTLPDSRLPLSISEEDCQ